MKKQYWLTLALLSFLTPACDSANFSVDEDEFWGDPCPGLNKINGQSCTENNCLIGDEQLDFSRAAILERCPKAYPICNINDNNDNTIECLAKNLKSCSIEDDPNNVVLHGVMYCFGKEGDGEKSFTQKCNNGKWDKNTIVECPNGCNPEHSACSNEKLGCEFDGDIVPHGSFRCFNENNGMVKACNNGVWEEMDECSNGCNDKKTDCTDRLGACHYENTVFSDTISHCFTETGKQPYVQTCKNGQWVDKTECNNVSCNGQEVACGQCKNGETKYENRMVKGDNGENQEICQSITCVNGTWVVDENTTCTNSCAFKADGSVRCGDCINGDSQCKETNNIGAITVCVNGNLEEKQCLFDNIPVGCLDETTCKECNDDQFIYYNEQDSTNADNLICQKYACQSGNWKNADGNLKKVDGYNCIGPCNDNAKDNCSCKEGEDCSCEENSTSCFDKKDGSNIGQSQICHDNTWSKPTNCENDSSCQSTSECGECKNGDKKCENNAQNVGLKYICKDGQWEKDNPTTCDNNVSCNDDNQTCGECKTGDIKYEDLPDKTCQYSVCENAQWKKPIICKNNVSCLKTSNTSQPSGCGECVNYTFKEGETNHDFYMCLNGKYEYHNCVSKVDILGWFPFKFEKKGSYLVCNSEICDDLNCYNINNIGYSREGIKDTPCQNNASCTITGVGASQCGECQDGKTRCRTPQMQQTCLNGQWGFDKTCNCTGEGVCELEQE